MCVAIYQNPGARMPDDAIVNGWVNNPDGGGFAHLDYDMNIRVYKSLDLIEFEDAYWEAWDEFGNDSPFMVHLRWGTHGENDLTNCHPFTLGEVGDDGVQTVMCHNGVLPIGVPDKGNWSDTRFYAAKYLSSLPEDWVDNPYLFEMVEDHIGASNKLIVLTNNPKLDYLGYIVNEQKGYWEDNVWYSNTSCKASTARYYNATTKSYPLTDMNKKKSKSVSKAKTGKGAGSNPKASQAQALSSPTSKGDKGDDDLQITMEEYYAHRYGWDEEYHAWKELEEKAEVEEEGDIDECFMCGEEVGEADLGVCGPCMWCLWCDAPIDNCICFESEYEGLDRIDLVDVTVGWDDDQPTARIHDMKDEEVAKL